MEIWKTKSLMILRKLKLLSKGIDSLIGKEKIIINPKSIDKILKENPIKELNTEKLHSLFLD